MYLQLFNTFNAGDAFTHRSKILANIAVKNSATYQPHAVCHTEDVVMNLITGKLNNGYSLCMDNFYNSIDLARKLLLKQTCCTGTLRMNRKNNPKEVTSKKLKTGELISKYTNNGICVFK